MTPEVERLAVAAMRAARWVPEGYLARGCTHDTHDAVVAEVLAAVRACDPRHHEGAWAVHDDGECDCECPRCWAHDDCICRDCTSRFHAHPWRDERLDKQAGRSSLAGDERG